MASPRSSPSMRPISPLSSEYKAPSHFDSRQPPSPRSMHSRPQNQRRLPNSSLQLPSLPRFHPGNFPSSHSSVQSTPDDTSSPQGPVSPRAFQRMYNNAQKQLYMNQRDLLAAAVRSGSPSRVGKPASPRLVPLGSPGPVTPFELEGEGYLTAGARNTGNSSAIPDDFVDKMVQDEVHRQQTTSSSR